MKMPNGQHAVVGDEKLLHYLLNPLHPVGGPHAILFDRLLGINRTCADVLRQALLRAASEEEAIIGKPSAFGEKFEIRFSLNGPRGSYTVLSVWMIKAGTDVPELVTAYITK
jgi:hypothetical protein